MTTKAGTSLKEIIGQAVHVDEMITHIATASTEQTAATEQVTASLQLIRTSVSESVAGAEDSAKACIDLSNSATQLRSLVGKFRVGASQSGLVEILATGD